MAAKVTAAAKLVATPFFSAGAVVRRFAAQRVAVTEGALGDAIARHDAAGTDLASTSTKDFINLQCRLFPYRVVRLADEVNEFSATWKEHIPKATLKDAVLTFRFLARLMATFMLGLMLSRQSMLPLIEPNSPLLPGIYEYHNPNN